MHLYPVYDAKLGYREICCLGEGREGGGIYIKEPGCFCSCNGCSKEGR